MSRIHSDDQDQDNGDRLMGGGWLMGGTLELSGIRWMSRIQSPLVNNMLRKDIELIEMAK